MSLVSSILITQGLLRSPLQFRLTLYYRLYEMHDLSLSGGKPITHHDHRQEREGIIYNPLLKSLALWLSLLAKAVKFK